MPHNIVKNAARCFSSFLSVICMMALSHGAFAGPVSGCDPKVLDAMNAAAEAKVAYDVAVTEQVTNKPDSVLALTCFNQAAGAAAKKGGAIFSGDFTDDIAPTVEAALTDHYRNFENAPGFDSGVVDYTQTATKLTDHFDCHEMQDLWDHISAKGIANDVPYIDADQMAAGTAPPGGGADFNDSMQAAQPTFARLKAAEDNLDKPQIPDFSGADSSCAVMKAADPNVQCP